MMIGWWEALMLAEHARDLPPEPRLRVWRDRFSPHWWWRVTDGHFGTATTHGEALAVGLAALEQASARVPA